MTLLADLAAARDFDLGALDDAGLAGVGALISRGRRDLAAFATAVAVEAKRRQASGSAPCPDDLCDPDGDQSMSARAKDAARGEIRSDLPAAGAGAESGAAKTENADHLAGRLRRLSASEKTRLAAHDRAIADNAAMLRPEAFRTWLARLLVKIANLRPPGQRIITAHDRATAAYELLCSITLTPHPGTTTGPVWPGPSDRQQDHDSGPATAKCPDDGLGTPTDSYPDYRSGTPAGMNPEHGSGTPTDSHPDAGSASATDSQPDAGVGFAGPSGVADGAAHDARPDPLPGSGDDRVMGPNLAVGIIIDAATLTHGPHPGTVAETWDGHPINPRAAQRRSCDADWYLIGYDQLGTPDRVGRTRRHATRTQRLALRALYPTCPLDGATPFARCEIHHVNTTYDTGGETELHNLIPTSPTWHHRIHDNGWTLTMDPDRTLHLHRPNGTPDRTIDPPTPITRHTPRTLTPEP